MFGSVGAMVVLPVTSDVREAEHEQKAGVFATRSGDPAAAVAEAGNTN